jgi:hypothetical protein
MCWHEQIREEKRTKVRLILTPTDARLSPTMKYGKAPRRYVPLQTTARPKNWASFVATMIYSVVITLSQTP